MTIALRAGVTKNTQSGGTSTSATVCTNVNGDILRLSVKVQNATTVTCTGWNVIGNASRGTDFAVYELWREASSEPGSYTINFGASVTYVDWIMRAYSGVDTATPIDSGNDAYDGTFGNYVVPAFDVTNDNSLVTISVCALTAGQTAPGGGTATQVEQQDDAGTIALTCYDLPKNAGSYSSEGRTGIGWCVSVVSLNEAAAGAPASPGKGGDSRVWLLEEDAPLVRSRGVVAPAWTAAAQAPLKTGGNRGAWLLEEESFVPEFMRSGAFSVLVQDGSGTSQPPGISAETDTALALTGKKISATALAAETDTALALTGQRRLAPGICAETDTAFARGWFSRLATETDTSVGLTGRKQAGVGVSAETDAALALSGHKVGAVAVALETDTALALTGRRALAPGVSAETDAALALTGHKATSPGRSDETDTAFSLLDPTHYASPGVSVETDAALALSGHKVGVVARADETDVALALAGAKRVGAGVALETDMAVALAFARSAAPGVSLETDLAFALTGFKRRAYGRADETDVALSPLPTPGIIYYTDTVLVRAKTVTGQVYVS